MIRVPNVRVVDEQGSQLGVLPTGEALRIAQERGYDLVEVAPMAVPPVVRLLDYGQYKYEAAKREKEARRHQRSVDFKEIRLKPKIGVGDFDTKVRRAIQFLEDGDRVKVACTFRGRELTHAYLGRELLLKFSEQVKDHGALERQPLLEGKSMSIVIASTHKPKTQGEGRPEAGSKSTEGRPEADSKSTERPQSQGPAPAGEKTQGGRAASADEPRNTAQPTAAARPAAPGEPHSTEQPAAEARPAAPGEPRNTEQPAAEARPAEPATPRGE